MIPLTYGTLFSIARIAIEPKRPIQIDTTINKPYGILAFGKT